MINSATNDSRTMPPAGSRAGASRRFPSRYLRPLPAERRARADWADGGSLPIRPLLEVSACSIPGNASTLTIAVERSAGGMLTGDPEMAMELAKLSMMSWSS